MICSSFRGSLGFDNPNEISARLFTVPYFFVTSFRYTASYWFSNVPRGRASGIIDRGDEKFFASSRTASRPLSSFDTHPRWHPVTHSARSRRSYARIEDCEQSKLETCSGRDWATLYSNNSQKKKNTIWQASKAKQAKSFQITLEILKKWYDIMG